jgi:hypothetical protein
VHFRVQSQGGFVLNSAFIIVDSSGYNQEMTMRFRPTWRLAAALALVLACGGAAPRGPVLERDPEQETALARQAGPNFRVKRTSHFVIAYDTADEVARELDIRLEQTCHMVFVLCDMNGIRARWPDRRLEVIFFDERPAYERHLAQLGVNAAHTFGIYHQQTNRSYFFNAANDEQVLKLKEQIAASSANIDKLQQSLRNLPADGSTIEVRFSDGERFVGSKAEIERRVNRKLDEARADLKRIEARRQNYCNRINQTVVQHETAHQMLFNAGLHVRGAGNPKWLIEGLACLFETPPGPPGSGFSALNTARLEDFRVGVGGQTKRRLTGRDYEKAVQMGQMVSPKDLILSPDLLSLRGDAGLYNYAVAWGLAHYLQRNEREKLAAYLSDVSARVPGDNPTPQQELDLFEKHFGPIDEIFLRRFSGYILGLTARAQFDS